ncbi:MAG TPA: glycosyltransferase family 4 protein [Gemmataceae bacterium]|jgi:glycosyltransferase involved in cell wall biosynthesis|nr:glycosyltransferase family 4 protein [Gemmataceae bacterium]
MTTRWAVVTGEYPPDKGGVADYAAQVARGLVAAGDLVTVYAPPNKSRVEAVDAVTVRSLPDHFGPRGLRTLGRELTANRPDRILVQYAPHSFGLRGMNVPLAVWIATRAGRIAPVWTMFHEVAYPFRWRPKLMLLHSAHRLMARLTAGAADRVFVSIPAWERILRKYCPRVRPAEWLPIPCTVDDVADATSIAAARARHLVGTRLVGHFGTFGVGIADLLEATCAIVLEVDPNVSVLLLGRGSTEFRERFAANHPMLASRVSAAGELTANSVAAHLRACDLLLQPYSDGLSTRRTTVMAGLANECVVVSNLGVLSEPIWATADCVRLARLPEPVALAAAVRAELDRPPSERTEMGSRARLLYQERFSLGATLAALRKSSPVAGVSGPLVAS